MKPLIIAVSGRAALATTLALGEHYPSVVHDNWFDHDIIDAHGDAPLILVGKSVAEAYGLAYLPYSIACGEQLMAVLPVEPDAARARACIAELTELAGAAEVAA